MNQKYINQDANETEIDKISTVFTDQWSSTNKMELNNPEKENWRVGWGGWGKCLEGRE